ncbi:MAG: sugar phosphate isomerase/epimerase [Planctomycetales bacterium]|nr:sugar phosphate isomerase/epimerase [Planctomycetales bacterium]
MSRMSVNELTTNRWSFEEDVTRYTASGIDAIGVWREKLSDYGAEKGAELLAEHGLRVSNLLWAGGFTGSDGRTFRESVDDAVEAIALAELLEAECLVVYSGALAGHIQKHARRLFHAALGHLLPIAAAANVTLALEPMYPDCSDNWSIAPGLDDALEVIEHCDSAYLKLVFDTYHLGFDPAVTDRIAELAPHVAVVHLADTRQVPVDEQNRCRLGHGFLPLSEIVTALEDHGYDGYYDVELFGQDVENFTYQELLDHSREAVGRLVGRPLSRRSQPHTTSADATS